MTALPAPAHHDRTRPTSPPRAVADVVAGLVNDGSAAAVAGAAVHEAARRGARVRFLQVVPPGSSDEERAEIDRATFRAALQGLRGVRRLPCTFEVVDGDAAEVLVARSRGAGLLVVGRDLPASDHDVAQRCQRLAACDVLTVVAQLTEPGRADQADP
ncbi:hypothetical protein GCM10027446_00820 [Angustibacter peucedani]